jgi:hypothetical protein
VRTSCINYYQEAEAEWEVRVFGKVSVLRARTPSNRENSLVARPDKEDLRAAAHKVQRVVHLFARAWPFRAPLTQRACASHSLGRPRPYGKSAIIKDAFVNEKADNRPGLNQIDRSPLRGRASPRLSAKSDGPVRPARENSGRAQGPDNGGGSARGRQRDNASEGPWKPEGKNPRKSGPGALFKR